MRPIDQHEPTRTCIGCRSRRPRRDLVRLTRAGGAGDRRLVVDGPSDGRGAWLCRSSDGGIDEECRAAALHKKQFSRAWRSTVTDDDVAAIRDAT